MWQGCFKSTPSIATTKIFFAAVFKQTGVKAQKYPIITCLILILHIGIYLGVVFQPSYDTRVFLFDRLTGYLNNNTCTSVYNSARLDTIIGATLMSGPPEFGGLPFHLHLITCMLVLLCGALRIEFTFGGQYVFGVWIFTMFSSPFCFDSYIGYGPSVVAVALNGAYIGALYKTWGHYDAEDNKWLKLLSVHFCAPFFMMVSSLAVLVFGTPTIGNLNHASVFLRSLVVGACMMIRPRTEKWHNAVGLFCCWWLIYGFNVLQKYFFQYNINV